MRNNNYGGGYNNKNKTPYGAKNTNYNNKPRSDVYVKKIDKVTKSEEPGFTGEPSPWFDDNEFFSKFPQSENKGEKDYYFNSYSSFYIHEEMIKDKVNYCY